MKKISVLTMCLLFLLVGCSKQEEPTVETKLSSEQNEVFDVAGYDRAIEKGKQAIKEGELDKAVASLELAIDYGTKDELAKELLAQVTEYQEIVEFIKQNNQEKNLDVIDSFLKTENLEEHLKQSAEELRKELEENTEQSPTTANLWDKDKAIRLKQFMTSWGEEMDQRYQEYNPTNNVDFYGISLPKGVLEGNMQMAVDNEPITIEWSTDGTGQAEYQLVAVHSDAETQDYLGKHVYFFVLHNGNPEVYLTMQNQGNAQNYLYFSETQNQDLRNGFSKIVNGEEAKETKENLENSQPQYISANKAIELTKSFYEQEESFGEELYFQIDDPSLVYIDEDGSRFYHVLGFSYDYDTPVIGYSVDIYTGEVKPSIVNFTGINIKTEHLMAY